MTPQTDDDLVADLIDLPLAEREAFLNRTCGDDTATRQRVLGKLARVMESLSLDAERPSLEGSSSSEIVHALTAGLEVLEKPGTTVGRYKLLQKIGEGGCGIVYLAEQQQPVRRQVALKLIKLGLDTHEFVTRFEAERQALAMMEHPNIARVFDAGATEVGRPYFVMELVRGIPITRYCDENRLSPGDRLRLFISVCQAIQHAHQKGVIHRDLKPSNILVTLHDGVPVPKIIDFGIAKAMNVRLTQKTLVTQVHAFIGTPAYTSPEQMEMSGLDVDTRSDIYSLGVLLYELLTSRPPFDSETLIKSGLESMRRTVREVEPRRPSQFLSTLTEVERAAVAANRATEAPKLSLLLRGDLDWIVMRCLEKDRNRRYDTASGLAMDIQRHLQHEPVVARSPSSVYLLQKLIRRHRVSFTAASIVISVVVIGAIATAMQSRRALRAERLQYELREAAREAQANEAIARRTLEEEHQRNEKIRWARETLLPGIERLIKKDDIGGAFDLAVEAEKHIPKDPALIGLWPQIAVTVNIETMPQGADVYLKPYRKPMDEWRHIGKSPLNNVRVARDFYRWQIRKDGYVTQEILDGPQFGLIMHPDRLKFSLSATGSVPAGMVPVQGATTEPFLTRLPSVQLQDYWIDKYEVTNREYKAFVEKGAYSTEALWNHPFVRGETVLTWSEAMALFQDTTDQPGPATWRNGTYLEGEADHPVTGVSWFEAAAYAQFVGKRLPSIHHWRHAAGTFQAAAVIPLSNFSRRGLARVGQYQGMSAYGAYDMAGNAKEWCWNEADSRKRFILGGGWSEPGYMFTDRDALQPFDRSPRNGFRCMKSISPAVTAGEVDEPLISMRRTYATETPVSEEAFQLYRRLYSYAESDLAAKVEAVDETDPRWRRENISFTAAYNNERMSAFLYLPKEASPPYQTIIYFPTSGALGERSSDRLWDVALFERLIENGRALIYPIYKGTYERKPRPAGFEWRTQLFKDLGRTIDYLETRTDVQIDKLSYLGISWGAIHGAWLPAIESRLKANVLIGGGFPDYESDPESDNINFAPRITIPTLMLNGRYDFIRPMETSQLPLFRWLGTSQEHKRHVLYETGHDVPLNQGNEEVFAWLDRYLGPVK